MPNAIRIHETGGPDAMRWEAIDLSNPGPGEVRVRHTAIGLNFLLKARAEQRRQFYKLPAGACIVRDHALQSAARRC